MVLGKRPRRRRPRSRKKARRRVPRTLRVHNAYAPRHSQTAVLKYCDSRTLKNTYHVFSVRNLHDPDFSGFGHQPFTWDQWTARYAQYRVLSCSYKVTFVTEPTESEAKVDLIRSAPSVVEGQIFGVRPYSEKENILVTVEQSTLAGSKFTQPGIDHNTILEQPRNKLFKYSFLNSRRRTTTLRGKVDMRSIIGPEHMLERELTDGGSTPHNGYVVVAATSPQDTAMFTTRAFVTMTYHVRFSHPHDLNAS